jgi:hypothetical protein
MTARLVHVLWMGRNGSGRALMPAAAWAVVEQQTPDARDPGTRYPLWWQMSWACFCDTGTERSIGFGVGPIPYRAILEWGRWRGIGGANLTTLVHVVRRMDAKYLEIEAARAEAERKNRRG